MALSRLVTLSISSLHNLDIEANKFYDRVHRLYDAAILTWCYNNMLFGLIQIPNIIILGNLSKFNFSKRIEFINLPSIFKDKSVISSIPSYFENKESPIICYKYNKPIRSTVFKWGMKPTTPNPAPLNPSRNLPNSFTRQHGYKI